MENKDEDRRVSVRMPFVSSGNCTLPQTGGKYRGVLRDISINGLFMEMADRLDVGAPCNIDIIFEGKHSRLLIEKVAGTIIRSEPDGIGVRFAERLEWFILIPLYYRKIRDQPPAG